MEKNKSLLTYRRIVQVLFALAFLACIFFVVITLSSYEKDMHYFKLGDARVTIYTVFAVAFSVVCLLSGLFAPKNSPFDNKAIGNKRSVASAVTDILSAIGILSVAVVRIKPIIDYRKNTLVDSVAKRAQIFNIVLVIFAVVSIAYFIYDCIGTVRSIRAILGFGIIFFSVAYLLCIYYDTTIPINSPMRILNQVSVIAFLFWFMLENRLILKFTKPKLYVGVGIIAFMFTISLSSATLLAIGLDKIAKNTYATVGSVMLLTFGCHIAIRVHSIICQNCNSDKQKLTRTNKEVDENA